MKTITLLGATGSIGQQTLAVIRAHPDQFVIHALAFGRNVELARQFIYEFQPEKVVVQDKETKQKLTAWVSGTKILVGLPGLIEVCTDEAVDLVVNAIIGRIGLEPTLQAIKANKTLAIANKETLVTAGHLVMDAVAKHQVNLLPVDSEHSAIFQCLQGENEQTVKKLIITASGGSFRARTRAQLADVSIEDALQHPNWSMGAKITIDSASMMNKGLEVIEAHWLFGLDYDKIDVILHKESVIHSMVEFQDRSVIAQLGNADMRIPIQYALSYPTRIPLNDADSLDLVSLSQLNFEKMDLERFPCLAMAIEAGKSGGSLPTVLNAANEQAVAMFLNNELSFLGIEDVIEYALARHVKITNPDLETILAIDEETRLIVRDQIKR
ncbi:1-deoxy-D-xylulose 5-phosphate reductoisomerase [Amphibacillus marinus]|uniref:1-deoxy-D-xylulose 5-phosphate reductoisomerase n=1 Tax=Amphibacillus marinus TaxID=872970 RepID=A0A1H8HN15_9BACI|nr:1-deoxy-D-xylulose-5-phosphate reductoisomerase [Amphibacillus marinus]SEN57463.1 1-deoxy-D-xylulose 5-phosphate reductoisomerase [Amphibacillus marinus]